MLQSPGLWNLSFSAPGYYTTSVNGVEAVDGKSTDLNVKMVRVMNSVDTTNPGSPFLYPNPAVSEIRAVLPLSVHGSLNIKIVNSTGTVFSDYDIESYPYTPVILSVKLLPAGAYVVVFRNKTEGISYNARFIVIKN